MKSRKFWSLFEAQQLPAVAMEAFKEIELLKDVTNSGYRDKMTELIMATFKRDEANKLVYDMSGPLYTETRSRTQSGYREGKVEGVLFRRPPFLFFLLCCYSPPVDLLVFILLLLVSRRVDKVEQGDQKLKV